MGRGHRASGPASEGTEAGVSEPKGGQPGGLNGLAATNAVAVRVP